MTSNPAANEYLAQILGEAKLLEKKLEKAAEARKGIEDGIRTALKGGNRPMAEKLALQLEQKKDDEARMQRDLAAVRAQYAQAKDKVKTVGQSVKSAQTMAATAKAMEGINKAMGIAKDTEDQIRKIEEGAAVAEAKMEIAMEEAEDHAKKVGADDAAAMKKLTAEQILREFEGK